MIFLWKTQNKGEKKEKGKEEKHERKGRNDVSFIMKISDMKAIVRTKVKLQKILIHYVWVKII